MAAESEIESFFEKISAAVSTGYNAVMEGGEIQAFFRQGVGELGNALVAFPQGSLHHEEQGAIFSPLYSDIVESREAYSPSPADLIERNAPIAQAQDQQQSPGISM